MRYQISSIGTCIDSPLSFTSRKQDRFRRIEGVNFISILAKLPLNLLAIYCIVEYPRRSYRSVLFQVSTICLFSFSHVSRFFFSLFGQYLSGAETEGNFIRFPRSNGISDVRHRATTGPATINYTVTRLITRDSKLGAGVGGELR